MSHDLCAACQRSQFMFCFLFVFLLRMMLLWYKDVIEKNCGIFRIVHQLRSASACVQYNVASAKSSSC